MSTQLTARTKAEEEIVSLFDRVQANLPGASINAGVRDAAIAGFKDFGLPHRRIEEWKYTDLRSAVTHVGRPMGLVGTEAATSRQDIDAALGPLAHVDADQIVFVDGVYCAAHSRISDADRVRIRSMRELLETEAGRDILRDTQSDGALGALNTAFVTDGAIVDIADQVELDRPLLLIFFRQNAADDLLTTRNVISVGEDASATIVEAFVSRAGTTGGQTNTLSQISVGDRAHVNHVKVGLEESAIHLATWTTVVGSQANYRAFQFTANMALVRNQVFARYSGENAKLDISGAFLGRHREHIDTTLVVRHEVEGCESRELFKGVLDDEARGVFQGKVIVQPEAQKTDGKQMAQALMLSEACEFDSKPELEIYADDVVCGHGSTCAEIDPDLIFYCRSRGIPEEQARALLIQSFITEAIDQVANEALADSLQELARRWLEATEN
ncbi:MAG: Fe-S cluster assembly protein SufD [Hyphomicrobiaceae bacterium]